MSVSHLDLLLVVVVALAGAAVVLGLRHGPRV
jgi:hypothetical protein